jgi:hypothetical protein
MRELARTARLKAALELMRATSDRDEHHTRQLLAVVYDDELKCLAVLWPKVIDDQGATR